MKSKKNCTIERPKHAHPRTQREPLNVYHVGVLGNTAGTGERARGTRRAKLSRSSERKGKRKRKEKKRRGERRESRKPHPPQARQPKERRASAPSAQDEKTKRTNEAEPRWDAVAQETRGRPETLHSTVRSDEAGGIRWRANYPRWPDWRVHAESKSWAVRPEVQAPPRVVGRTECVWGCEPPGAAILESNAEPGRTTLSRPTVPTKEYGFCKVGKCAPEKHSGTNGVLITRADCTK